MRTLAVGLLSWKFRSCHSKTAKTPALADFKNFSNGSKLTDCLYQFMIRDFNNSMKFKVLIGFESLSYECNKVNNSGVYNEDVIQDSERWFFRCLLRSVNFFLGCLFPYFRDQKSYKILRKKLYGRWVFKFTILCLWMNPPFVIKNRPILALHLKKFLESWFSMT